MGLSTKLAVLVAIAASILGYSTLLSEFSGSIPLVHVGIPYGFNPKDIPDLTGKTFIVTGANAGLGKYATFWLSSNGAEVILGCRSMSKCESAIMELRSMANDTRVPGSDMKLSCMKLDLSSFASVKSFVKEVKENYNELNSLILNAGLGYHPFALTEDNIEMTYQVNNFSQHLLIKLLLPLLPKDKPSSVALVGSLMYKFSKPLHRSLADMNSEVLYSVEKRYDESKLGNIYTTQQLQKQLDSEKRDIYVNVIHPGLVKTTFLDKPHHQEAMLQLQKNLMLTFAWHPREASLSLVGPAVAPFVTSENYNGLPPTRGEYIIPIARIGKLHGLALNETMSREFFELSEEIIRPHLE